MLLNRRTLALTLSACIWGVVLVMTKAPLNEGRFCPCSVAYSRENWTKRKEKKKE